PDGFDTTGTRILSQLDDSLRRLRSDHVDLWQLHVWSDLTPLSETLSALRTAMDSGRARRVGVCNYSPSQLAQAHRIAADAGITISTVQSEYSLLVRDAEALVPELSRTDTGLVAWSPLAGGVLTGKYRDETPPGSRATDTHYLPYLEPFLTDSRTVAIVAMLDLIGDALDVSPTQVALAWVRQRPAVTRVLLGARTVEQLRHSLDGAGLTLPADVHTLLTEATEPESPG
ncbi:MAG: aldo/keto reductase, partial [Stackebrandtia sp.]